MPPLVKSPDQLHQIPPTPPAASAPATKAKGPRVVSERLAPVAEALDATAKAAAQEPAQAHDASRNLQDSLATLGEAKHASLHAGASPEPSGATSEPGALKAKPARRKGPGLSKPSRGRTKNAPTQDGEALTALLLLHGLGHDVGNALSPLAIGIGMLRKGAYTKPALLENILDSMSRSLSAARLTIANYTRLGLVASGDFNLHAGRTDLAKVLKDSALALQEHADHADVIVELLLPDAELPVLADSAALAQICANLIGNAIKYSNRGSRVAVSVQPDPAAPGWVRISVKDSGVGVEAEDLQSIFTGVRTLLGKKKADGTGTGLRLVKFLVEAHGGRIEVQSAPGQGSTFSFSLPAWEQPEL